MASGLPAFPAILPSGTVVGRIAIGPGPAEAIPIAALWATLNGSSYAGQIVTKRKSANQSQASNTVLANDADLTFAVGANEEWTTIFEIAAGAAIGTTGFKVAITVPSGATLEADAIVVPDSIGGGAAVLSGTTTTSGGNILADTPPAACNNGVVRIFCWILNGTTSGNVTLQWAQNASSVTNLTFRKGSFMQATRVA